MKNINLDEIKPELYQKAFTFQYLGYLLTYYFLSNYRKIDFLIIYNETWWRSLIPVATVGKTMEEGKRLFGENFDEYYSGFKKVIEECDDYLKNIPSEEGWVPKKEDWISLQDIIDKLYFYYEKTEFFYADAGYKEENKISPENMKLVGEIKLDGRQRLNDLLINSLYKYADRLAQSKGLNSDDLKFYNYEEVLNLYDDNQVLQEIIEERKKSYVLYCKDGEIIPLDNEQKEIVIENFKEKSIEGVKEFKGITASKGVVEGKVRVILANYQDNYEKFLHEVEAMQEGEILVTETTSPEFVPAMKKAIGVITNQGGLGSHAAIVSREFGIPCIVGTERATEILKTGDLIKLDATGNKVTVLEKS